LQRSDAEARVLGEVAESDDQLDRIVAVGVGERKVADPRSVGRNAVADAQRHHERGHGGRGKDCLRELRSLRNDVLGLVDEPGLHEAVAARFAAANFPFRKERLIPRIIVRGTIDGGGLEPGLRNQPRWSEDEKRALIRRGWELADEQLSATVFDAYTEFDGT
jgi:hypothetical protein